MNKEFSQAAEYYSNELAHRIEQAIPDCRIKDMGWLIVVFLENKSVFTINLLSAARVDVVGEDCTNKHWDLVEATWEQALDVLTQVNGLMAVDENDLSATAPRPADEQTPSHATEPSKTWWTGKYPIGHRSGSLGEESTTGAVAGYSPANAFSDPRQKINRGTEQSRREGWEVIGEKRERDQSGRHRGSDHPFGEDPLGRHAMNDNPDKKKNSEGRRKTETGHNWEGGSPLALSEAGLNESGSISQNQTTSETLVHLSQVLPVNSAKIDANTLTVEVGGATIFISAQANGHFAIQSQVDGEVVQASENVAAGDLIKWAFTICDRIRDLAAKWGGKRAAEKTISSQMLEPREEPLDSSEDWTDTDNIPPSDVYEVLNELAKETGKPTDPIRNKALFDLRQGLLANPNTLSGRRFWGSDFNAGHTADAEISASLKGSTTTPDGTPVSINEHRDLSKPYADTLGGKKLVYVQGHGAVFVDKSQLPTKKKLNFDPQHGVILTEETEPTNRKNMWRLPHTRL